MNQKYVTIKSFDDSMQADLSKQLLEDNGIKGILENENVSNAFPGVFALARIELKVAESEAERALEILNSNEELD